MNINDRFKDFYTPSRAEEIVLNNFSNKTIRTLDFGCGDGYFTRKLLKVSKKVFGCDLDRLQILSNQKSTTKIEYKALRLGKRTPYKSSYFDCVTLMGVIEHVENERETISEIARILDKDGQLFIYTHNKGILGFLDPANIKFISPVIHKTLYSLIYSKEKYREQFVDKKKLGMTGDFSEGKRWHTHYSKADFEKILLGKFVIEKIWYYSLFLPILQVLEFLYISYFGKSNNMIRKLIQLDNSINLGKFSYVIVLKCRRINT